MLGHETSLNKFKKTEIISSIFSDPSDVELEINRKKDDGKVTNVGNLNNMRLNNHWVNAEIKEDIKKNTWRSLKMKIRHTKIYGMQQKQF